MSLLVCYLGIKNIYAIDMNLGKGVNLKDFSNFNIGGPARDFVQAESFDELVDSVKTAKQVNLPVFILGGGTNILWSDNGYSGVVLQPAFEFIQTDGEYVTAGAGVSMSKLVSHTVSRGMAGLEWAGGLPGSFGGAIFGNAGCFGGEIKDLIVEVVSLDMDTLKLVHRNNEECGFGYRTSIFKSGNTKEVIVQATIELSKGDKILLNKSVEEKISYRALKHPLEYPNIGSIFKNVRVEGLPALIAKEHERVVKTDPFPVIPAAYLIDKSKLKGLSVGGALISPKHPNFIVNVNDAKASDVVELIGIVKEKVRDKFDIGLEEEVLIVD